MMQALNLPIDVWFAIMQHLSLADLSALYTAFASSTIPVDLSVINRFAVNTISRLFASGKCNVLSIFSDNGPCYKFRMTGESAGKCLHGGGIGDDLNPPCGSWYDPNFSNVEFSQTLFHSHPDDMTTANMTILANDGKSFDRQSTRQIFPTILKTGPTELIEGFIEFHESPTKFLQIFFSTCEANIEETCRDVPHSPTRVVRTVAHNIPLKYAQWVELLEETQKWTYTNLPKKWYQHWLSEI